MEKFNVEYTSHQSRKKWNSLNNREDLNNVSLIYGNLNHKQYSSPQTNNTVLRSVFLGPCTTYERECNIICINIYSPPLLRYISSKHLYLSTYIHFIIAKRKLSMCNPLFSQLLAISPIFIKFSRSVVPWDVTSFLKRFTLQQSAITIWRTHELVRWERFQSYLNMVRK